MDNTLTEAQMLVRMPAATLLAALKIVKHGKVSGQTSLPVLRGVRIRADYTSCWLECYDLNFGVTVRVSPADISAPGEVIISHAALSAVVRQLDPGDTVTLTRSGDKLQLAASRFVTDLCELCLTDEWPLMKTMPEIVATTLRPAVMAGLSDVARAASTEEERPVLNGVYLEIAPATMRATATNGHRMIMREDWSPADATIANIIVPPKLFSVAKAVFSKVSGSELRILSETFERTVKPVAEQPAGDVVPLQETVTEPLHAWLRQGDVTLYTRLLEGPYPNYSAVIPSQDTRETSVLVDRRQLLAAVSRVGAVASDQTHRLVLTFNGNVGVSCETPDLSTASEHVQHAGIVGSSMKLGVNAEYVQDLLGIARTDRVALELWGPDRAILIRPEHDASTTMLLMPLQLLDD